MIKIIVALLAVFAFSANAVFAFSTKALPGFDGPIDMPKITTAESISDMKAHTKIILQGYLVKQINKEHYLFKDGTGNVEVDIEDQIFKGANVTPETQIRLRGKVDKDLWEATSVDVDYLEIVE